MSTSSSTGVVRWVCECGERVLEGSRHTCSSFAKQIADLKLELNTARNDVSTADATLLELAGDRNNLASELAAAKQERDKYHTLLNDMQDANREAKQEIERLKGLLEDLKGCGDEVHAFDIQDSRERVFFMEKLKATRQRDRLRAGIEGLEREWRERDAEGWGLKGVYRWCADALSALLKGGE